MDSCPVCRNIDIQPFQTIKDRRYLRCGNCEATFLEPGQHPTPEQERCRYDQHNNDPADDRYVTFLRRLADPVLERIPAGSAGLDFGSGPAPVLADLLRAEGHDVHCYDPFYAPDREPLQGEHRYHFITCCEVAEHLHHPAAELDRLWKLLRPGALLAVMTEFQTDDERFAGWYYRQDRTHVVFYRERTFSVIARDLGGRLEIPRRNVALIRKTERPV